MSSIVIELQRDALNGDFRVSDLLRKALVVATKLKMTDFQSWINSELNGYTKGLPEYRFISGQPQAWNPVLRAWIPVVMDDPDETNLLSSMPCGQSVAEIEKILAQGSGGTLLMHYPRTVEKDLMNNFEIPLRPALIVQRSSLTGILDRVRNIILQWALKLEEDGILGEEITFTTEERDKASNLSHNIYQFFGPISDSQIQAGSPHSVQTFAKTIDLEKVRDFVTEARGSISKLELEPDQKKELEAELQTLESQLASPKPKMMVIKECLRSSRSILEGLVGSAIASGLLHKLGLFVQ